MNTADCEVSSMALRRYQELIIEQAKDTNTIAFLPTGTGKTLIACYLIGYRLKNIRVFREQSICGGSGDGWGKAVIFIAPTKALLGQQVKYITDYCPERIKAVELNGSKFYQNKQIEFWDHADWKYHFQHFEVLGLTPEILRHLLDKDIIPADALDTIIIDECHHATGNHPMGLMCDALSRRGLQPLVFGMTASPTHTKKGKAMEDFRKLEDRLQSQFFMPSEEILKNLQSFKTHPLLCIAEHPAMVYADLKDISALLRHCINLEKVFCANAHPAVVSLQLYDQVCQQGARDRTCFQLARKPTDFETILSQTAEVAGMAGHYCGLLALLSFLQEDKDSWPAALAGCAARKANFLAEVDAMLFKDMVDTINGYIGPNAAVFTLLRDQPRCIVEAMLALVREIVVNVLGSTNERIEVIQVYISQQHESNILMEILLREIGEGDGRVRTFDKFLNMGSAIQANASGFFHQLQLFLVLVRDKISLRPVLRSVTPSALRHAGGSIATASNLLSHKVHRLFELLLDFFSTTASVPFLSSKDMHKVTSSGGIEEYSSATVEAVFNKPQQQAASDSSAAIAFCSMRIMAKVLHELTERIASEWASVFPATPFPLRPAVITGQHCGTSQSTALSNLKSGVSNLLFATEVAEEGLDVKSCNLIVNFDAPKTVKSFTQRRGRARAGRAYILQMLAKPFRGEDDFKDLIKFLDQEQKADKALLDCLTISRDFFGSAGSAVDQYVVPSTKACADNVSAMQMVHEYCQSLATDDFDVQKPTYVFDRLQDEHSVLFKCTITLPPLAGLAPLSSHFRPNKRVAKGCAALSVVKMLHLNGTFDDNLRLVSRAPASPLLRQSLSVMMVIDSLPVTADPMVEVEVKVTADALLATSAATRVHMYTVVVELENASGLQAHSLLPWRTREHIKAIHSVGFALPHPLSEATLAAKTEIFVRDLPEGTRAWMRFQHFADRKLSAGDLAEMQRFHQAVCCLQADCRNSPPAFSTAINHSGSNPVESHVDWTASSNGAWYTVFPAPASECALSSEFIASAADQAQLLVTNLRAIASNCQAQPSGNHFFPVGQAAPQSDKAMLITSNGMNLLYHSDEINVQAKLTEDLRKLSDIMANSNGSFAEHFSKKNPQYQALVHRLQEDEGYRLSRVYSASSKLTLLDLLKPNLQKEKHEPLDVIAEACQPLGLAKWYYASLVVPSVAHRLHSLLLADEANSWLVSKLSSKMQFDPPPVALMLQAITPKLVLETINSERLEFYGDSVLKYISSLAVFCRSPEADQGELTAHRTAVISNAFLAARAQQSGLLVYLRAHPLSRGLEEVLVSPPGLRADVPSLRNTNVQRILAKSTTVAPDLAALKTTFTPRKQHALASVGHKTLADLVEAVLGTIYSHARSEQAVLAFLQAVGVLCYDVEAVKTAFMEASAQLHSKVHVMTKQSVAEVEQVIGYHFHRPEWLAMAFTHKSCAGKANLERLEFLGDAVLDLIVVEHLYGKLGTTTDEGQLTAEKSARTKNSRLAAVCLELELEQYINHDAYAIQMSLSRATAAQKDGSIQDDEAPKTKLLADVLEAVIGAVYVDSGFLLAPVAAVVVMLGILE